MSQDRRRYNGSRSEIVIGLAAILFVVILAACSGQAGPPELSVPSPESTFPLETPVAPPQETPVPVEPSPAVSPTLPPTPTLPPQLPMPLFGTEPHRPYETVVMDLLVDSGTHLVRYGGVFWDAVEAQEGVYNWGLLKRTDSVLEQLSAHGIEVILIVRGAPLWAQKVYGHTCGPVAPDKLPAFAEFMQQLVRRYSQPPYNVRYWELGNEPDVAWPLVPADSVFGCWGDRDAPYYGGEYYAEMLKVVYPAIKAADPQAQVLNGGLLMDCDPDNPPEGADCRATTFFEGILHNGGGDYLDIVNFHGYPPFVQGSLMMDTAYPPWAARGGVVVGKISYLRETMKRYGVDKPIFLTETSLVCPEWNQRDCAPPKEAFFRAQADYLVRSFLRNWAMNVQGTVWYDFEGKGWRYASMVGVNLSSPNPAFHAFRFLNAKLADARLESTVPEMPGIDGYAFVHPDGTHTWVLWSRDETPQIVVMPVGVTAVYDVLGSPLPPGNGPELEVASPTYIDFVP